MTPYKQLPNTQQQFSISVSYHSHIYTTRAAIRNFPRYKLIQKILQLTEKDGFGDHQISSLKKKLTPI